MREGWKAVTLGEAANVVRKSGINDGSRRYVGLEHLATRNPRIQGSADSAAVLSASTAFGIGDVLFGKLRPYLEKVAVADFDGVCTNEILVWRTKDDAVLHQSFLALVLQSSPAIEHAVNTSAGSRMPRTTYSHMSQLEINLPPLEEQQRIVDLIGSLDEAIEAADETVNATENGAAELRHDLLAPRPGTCARSLAKVAEWASGKFVSKENRVAGGQFPILGANGEIGRSNCYLYDEPVITVGRVGACGEVHRSSGKAWVSDNALVARPEPEDFEYVFHALRSVDFKPLISGTSQPLITQTALLKVQIAWPEPKERTRIARLLEDVDEAQQNAQSFASSLRATRSELLTVLLSGVHEIPESYDPDIAALSESAV